MQAAKVRAAEPLQQLLFSLDNHVLHFRANSWTCTSALQLASTGAQVDWGNMGSNANIHIFGSVYHCLGPLMPVGNQAPRFDQLNLVDTEHESQNCMTVFDKAGKKQDRGMCPEILGALHNMLHNCNRFVRKMQGSCFK